MAIMDDKHRWLHRILPFTEWLGEVRIAINALHAQTHVGGDEENCPLKTVVTTSNRRMAKEN